MTEELCKRLTDEMIDKVADEMKQKVARAITSGAVNLSGYEDDSYRLPRIILTALLKEVSYRWKPVHKADVRRANNLYICM